MREQDLRTDFVIGPKLRQRLLNYVRKKCRRNINNSYTVEDLDPFARADIAHENVIIIMKNRELLPARWM
ncbi:unnamed protein product [Cylicocyclus nassatus]|uniref:Uncharacterized protein n=1 Tax=Cylicocyclus nassatus TaxID=53992 RepID=A0AA36MBR7_CYLNA|nr:unnamed protein product [Cylicocyclus nassatus]